MRLHISVLLLAWFGHTVCIDCAEAARVGCQETPVVTPTVLGVEYDERTRTAIEVRTAGREALEVVARAPDLVIHLTVCEDGRARLRVRAHEEALTLDAGRLSVVVVRNERQITLTRLSPMSLRVAARALVDGSPLVPTLRDLVLTTRDATPPSLVGVSLEVAHTVLTHAISDTTSGAGGRLVLGPTVGVRHAMLRPTPCWDVYWSALHLAAVDLASCLRATADDLGCQFGWNRQVNQAYYRLLECLLQ